MPRPGVPRGSPGPNLVSSMEISLASGVVLEMWCFAYLLHRKEEVGAQPNLPRETTWIRYGPPVHDAAMQSRQQGPAQYG
jgi:hypothetical protein